MTRSFLLNRLRWRVKRDDAFITLSLSAFVLILFIALVWLHIRIDARDAVQRGMEAWMDGYYDTYGNDVEHVGDHWMMVSWLRGAGIPAILGYCHTVGSEARCPLASDRTVLIGDVMLVQKRHCGRTGERYAWHERSEPACSDDDVEKSDPALFEYKWLLHESPEILANTSNNHRYMDAALATLARLEESGWIDSSTSEFRVDFIAYNENRRTFMYASTGVRVQSSGLVIPACRVKAVMSEPYGSRPFTCPAWLTLALDLIYMLFTFWVTYGELSAMMADMRILGCFKGFVKYWDVWNVMDWFNLVCAYANAIQWIIICIALQEPEFVDVIRESDGRVAPKVMPSPPHHMGWETSRLESLREQLLVIYAQTNVLQITMAFNTVSILLKFFKGFQANNHLKLVTDTLARAYVDLAHFFLVWAVFYVGFALMGHLLFGNCITEFSTIPQAMNVAFVMLAGEFEWFMSAILTDELFLGEDGIGVFTKIALVAWFYSYTLFVVMVLMNMLLAIVVDHYAVLREKHALDDSAPTIWKQAMRIIHRRIVQRKFIPLAKVAVMLEKQKHANPGDQLTTESLMAACSSMQPDQAQWIIDWLKGEAANQRQLRRKSLGELPSGATLDEISVAISSMSERIDLIALSSERCNGRLDSIEKTLGANRSIPCKL